MTDIETMRHIKYILTPCICQGSDAFSLLTPQAKLRFYHHHTCEYRQLLYIRNRIRRPTYNCMWLQCILSFSYESMPVSSIYQVDMWPGPWGCYSSDPRTRLRSYDYPIVAQSASLVKRVSSDIWPSIPEDLFWIRYSSTLNRCLEGWWLEVWWLCAGRKIHTLLLMCLSQP